MPITLPSQRCTRVRGAAHGFTQAIDGVAPGAHRIWVYAINVAGGGGNPLLATADVTVPTPPAGTPFGAFDSPTGRVGGAARVIGCRAAR